MEWEEMRMRMTSERRMRKKTELLENGMTEEREREIERLHIKEGIQAYSVEEDRETAGLRKKSC